MQTKAKHRPQRSGLPDRRDWEAGSAPLAVDEHGNVVPVDRRRIPDRRLNNIEVVEQPEKPGQ